MPMNAFARRYALSLLITLVLLIAVPVHAQNQNQAQNQNRESGADKALLVFAAASLKNAMDGVVEAYEKQHDTDVRVSYAGSSTLARQIQQGAPADVYVSANQDWMDVLEDEGLIAAGSRFDLLRNSIVLIAPAAADRALTVDADTDLLAALGEGEYLAMATVDAVPAGIYGRQALESLGLWSQVQPRVAQAEDVRAALALVARGEAPLGIVYASDALAEDRVQVLDTFPADTHDPIVYPAAAIAGDIHPASDAFLDFLATDAAAEVFKRWGFEVVDGA